MSIWAEIKKAVNSTLGTADFKPLDKIFTDELAIYSLDSAFKTIDYSEIPTTQTKMRYNGAIKIKLTISEGTSSSVGKETSLRINLNGTFVRNLWATMVYNQKAESSCEIAVQKGDIITLANGDNYHYIDSVSFCGIVGFGAPIEQEA